MWDGDGVEVGSGFGWGFADAHSVLVTLLVTITHPLVLTKTGEHT